MRKVKANLLDMQIYIIIYWVVQSSDNDTLYVVYSSCLNFRFFGNLFGSTLGILSFHVAFQQARLFSSGDLQREITTSCSRTRCSAIIFVHGVVLSRHLIFAAQPLRYPCHVLVMACDMGFHNHRTVQRAACPFSFREISYHWRADGRFFLCGLQRGLKC